MKIAGLSIEDSHIRVSIVKKVLGTVKALRSEEIHLPEDNEQKCRLLKEALLRWKKDYGIKGIVLGIDFKDFSHHFINLPLKSRADIAQALNFEMEKHLPLPPDEYLFDFCSLEHLKEGTRNLVLCIRKERLKWIVECLKDTGISLLGVRCSLLVSLNEFISEDKKDDVIFVYPAVHRYYIAGLKGSLISHLKVIDEHDFVSEIEKLKETFTRGIYMSGIGSIPTDSLNIKSLPFSIPNLIAVSALRGKPLDLNFMPEELVIKSLDYYPYLAGIISILSVVLFVAGDFYAYYKDYSALKEVENRITEIKQTAHNLIEIKREFEGIEEKTGFLANFESRANDNIKILRQLSILLPEDVWLTDFSAEKGHVEIKGFAKRAVNIIEPFETSALFKKVEFSSPITKKDDTERFSIRMEVEE